MLVPPELPIKMPFSVALDDLIEEIPARLKYRTRLSDPEELESTRIDDAATSSSLNLQILNGRLVAPPPLHPLSMEAGRKPLPSDGFPPENRHIIQLSPAYDLARGFWFSILRTRICP